MDSSSTLERAREAFRRQAWAEARDLLSSADREAALGAEDLERLATASYLIGRDVESSDVWARAHQESLQSGDTRRAVRCAFWLAHGLIDRGEHARGSGWITRARRLLEDCAPDCAEHGYLLLPAALQSIDEREHERSAAIFAEAARIGDRCGDPDLAALAGHGRGRALIRMGRTEEGVALLDEAMVAVEAGEVSPLVAGDVYCGVIAGCLEILDLRRAREWTAEMSRWCERHPDLTAYRGQCLVRRAEILQLHGAWADAVEAAEEACERCQGGPDRQALGAAHYQKGELHRLRGEWGEAAKAFQEAARAGRNPQPGLALMRFARGQTEAAVTAIRLALDEARDRRIRARLLPAAVEIMLAADDVAAAREAADELAAMAADLDAPLLHAVAAQARGAVLLAGNEGAKALPALRQAWRIWQDIDSPYEAARVRVLIGMAYRRLGDTDAADMEHDAAQATFQQLGALPELLRAEALARAGNTVPAPRLSARESQVLQLLASGRTNRAIAAELFISERTVERHVSNIFIKLDVPSRAAATAYAYEHGLVRAVP